jgi:ribosomal peptide maturation radical SAM protein 1
VPSICRFICFTRESLGALRFGLKHLGILKEFAVAVAPQTDVVFVSMPFGILNSPSLALSLLDASLRPADVSTATEYFTLTFAARFGKSFYRIIGSGAPSAADLLGEWIFSEALHGTPEGSEQYLSQVLAGGHRAHCKSRLLKLPKSLITRILQVRSETSDFLDDCVERVLAHRPLVVALTSVFQQHVASLALAKRLKQRKPELSILMGGANCEGEMGLATLEHFPFVDHIVSGEGDLVFPLLVQRVLAGLSVAGLRGVLLRQNNSLLPQQTGVENSEAVRDMDSLPVPEFDAYCTQLQKSGLQLDVFLPLESSRGCWWGEKHHCTFCGLNGESMAHRSKSANRVVSEVRDTIAKYPCSFISMTDNILDMRAFRDLLPMLAREKPGVPIFFETKSNLKKHQIELLSDAGVQHIQPGIESLDDSVLSLMRKGVTALQNVQLLKWCREYGIHVTWAILYGFPRESPAAYDRMARMMRALVHLQPPGGLFPIRLDRFSPNFTQADSLGLCNVQPMPSYSHVYRLAQETTRSLAYFFSYDYQVPQFPELYTRQLLTNYTTWRKIHSGSECVYLDRGERLQIWRLIPGSETVYRELSGLQRTLYLACDEVRSLTALMEIAQSADQHVTCSTQLLNALQPLIDDLLLLNVGERFLSLAVSLSRYRPSNAVMERLQLSEHIIGSSASDAV